MTTTRVFKQSWSFGAKLLFKGPTLLEYTCIIQILAYFYLNFENVAFKNANSLNKFRNKKLNYAKRFPIVPNPKLIQINKVFFIYVIS